MRSLFARVVGDLAAMAGKGLANKATAVAASARDVLAHILGRVSGKYYWEDYVRVYPEPDDPLEFRNFLNHRKFYAFAAQFARGAKVADIGCGSGYGSSLLKHSGAAAVWGSDASDHAIAFARANFGADAEFSVQGMTRMKTYRDGQFDLAICSEVLEHIKEYGRENEALEEMNRIVRPGGIVVIGTPNSELLGDHGFHFGEMDALMKRHFGRYCIFENALVPYGPARALWEQRRSAAQTGVLVTQAINLDETVLLHGGPIEVKIGADPGVHFLGELKIDTTLLHNTHSWAIVAIRD